MHFKIEQRLIVTIGFVSAREGKTEALIKPHGMIVVAGNHQAQV
jgi:hypothetical protein